MAACGSLQHIFENPLSENPTLLDSLSRNQIKPVKPIEQFSFTEIFGELHFKESPESSPSSSSFSHVFSSSSKEISPQNGVSVSSTPKANHTKISHKSRDSFSSLNSESLQLCTEGLGFESSDDVEDLKTGMDECWQTQREKAAVNKRSPSEDSYGECRSSSRLSAGDYPPPISCIGRTGMPLVCFRSFRYNGRFVLKEIRIPTQEFLHAYREDGRLKLHFVQPDDDFLEELEEEEDDDDDIESVDGDEREAEVVEKELDYRVTVEGNEEKEISV